MMKENSQPETEQLSRGLKSRHVQLIAIGGTIGTGLFLGAGQSIHLAGPAILIAYLVTGLVCFLLMRALGELLLSDLHTHSYIDFIKQYLGDKTGFVAGWTYWVCWITIAMAEITAAGEYMQFWWPKLPQWLPGLVILILLLGLNSINVSAFGETEFWFAIIKIAAIIALIAVGVGMVIFSVKTPVGHASLTNLVNYGGFMPHGIKGLVLSFQMVLFSFIGIEMVGMTASETADPKTVIPKAINDIPVRIILFYVGSLFFLMCMYPWQYFSAAHSPFVQVFTNLGIRSAAAIINFVVLTAAASSCNSALFSTGRMLFSLTYDGQSKFAKRMGTLSTRQVPRNALWFSTLVIGLSVILNLLMPGKVFSLIASVSTTCFIFIWGAIVVAHIKYRRQAGSQVKVKFRMPLFPLSDYFILVFLGFIAVVLCLKFETLIALIVSAAWVVGLYVVKIVSDRIRQRSRG
ncbi:amino acid permease [Lactiplantibacillus paraplantarum]|uniref:Amino acid permease n=1 Tax=Lactiplantibacillus paraplantarum TaxID=60520 RepID=A0A2I9CQ36_9LACO|nr:amino acid permease [Lactiplantibacillus paraplantarum]AVW10736.1 amino acid permease [Lactiplantibacillus paraplantarum]AYJ39086.1 amino acid permease [Lactiplantibacillus paraplantarum]ERL42969.1 amino acid transport protein [Lactiplantibacillus paraplantarum]KRL49690.1 amino acid transport protein [Lactiplantibacillus paraplantarum DSM 10667]MCU4684135.1 amino acid permease [Lactiplantibacillus paraplantarum]